MPKKRYRQKCEYLYFKGGVDDEGGGRSGKKRDATENCDAKSDPIPHDRCLQELGGRLPSFTNSQEMQVQADVGAKPQGQAREMGHLHERIGPSRGGDEHSGRRILQPFGKCFKKAVHFEPLFNN